MNVALTISASAGTDRADVMARRTTDAEAEGGGFSTLFDEVGQATAAVRTAQSDPAPGTAADDADADVAWRSGGSRRDTESVVGNSTQETKAEPDADMAGGTGSTVSQSDSQPDRLPRQDKDASRGQADPADDGEAMPAGPGSAGPSTTKAAAPSGGKQADDPATGAGGSIGRDTKRTHRKSDGQVQPADSSATAAPMNATAAIASPVAPASDRTREPAPEAPGKGNGTTGPSGRESPSGGSGQAKDVQPDAGQVRYWARGSTAAALAAAATGRSQQNGDVVLLPPTRGGGRSVDVRVTAYETHLAPLGSLAGAKAAPTTGADLAKNVASTPELAAKRAGQAAADVGQDQIATADAPQPSGHEAKDAGQGKMAAFATSSGQGDQKQQTGGSPSGNAPVTGTSAPAAATQAPPLVAAVASGIANALNAAQAAAAGQTTLVRAAASVDAAASDSVRTIALNLDMREYGRIDLRISLKGNAVSVQVKANQAETADALARDDAALRDALHRAGYEAQQIQIDRRDGTQQRLTDAAAPGQQQGGGAGTGASSGNAAGGGHAATPDSRPQARPNGNAFALHDQDTHDAPRQDRYRGPDRLYV